MIFSDNDLKKEFLLERKKMLLDMKKEIDYLEYQKNNFKLIDKKNKNIRKFKSFLCASRLLSPYVIVAYLSFLVFSFNGCNPFLREFNKVKFEIKKEIDSLGNIKIENTNNVCGSNLGTITYYSKWKKCDDSFYSRQVKIYNVDDISENAICKIVSDGDTSLLDDFFCKPISVISEKRSNLTFSEINRDDYLQAVIYSDDDNYVYIQESFGKNLRDLFFWLFITLGSELGIMWFRDNLSKFDYYKSLEKIKDTYSDVDIEEVEKKLEIRKMNYNRLVSK